MGTKWDKMGTKWDKMGPKKRKICSAKLLKNVCIVPIFTVHKNVTKKKLDKMEKKDDSVGNN
jgi:hypothetical protein